MIAAASTTALTLYFFCQSKCEPDTVFTLVFTTTPPLLYTVAYFVVSRPIFSASEPGLWRVILAWLLAIPIAIWLFIWVSNGLKYNMDWPALLTVTVVFTVLLVFNMGLARQLANLRNQTKT